jgi:hypothetical protein
VADSVQLTDLDVITRYSIAVRSASADRDELIETLRGDLAWLERGRARTTTTYAEPVEAEYEAAEPDHEPEPAPEPRRSPVRRASSARKTAAKKTPAKRAAR